MTLTHRHYLREKEARAIIEEIQKTTHLPVNTASEQKVEVANIETETRLILINNKPAFLKTSKGILPTLTNTTTLQSTPTITVDAGAVPHICNGSDLMAPGIVKISGDFPAQSITAVAEQTYGKTIALVRTLIDAEKMRTTKRGKVAINLHYIGDRAWNAYKNLA